MIGMSSVLFPMAEEIKQTWDGSRTTPIHRIPLKDEFDQTIIPTESHPLPYSTRFTCAPCHDYKTIQTGFHFNELTSQDHGRAGEPWIWVDPKTGTLLPLSYRSRKGIWHPKDLGLSFWDFTLLFSRHLTGGGAGEPIEEKESPESRWQASGKLEINCMGCHSASRLQSHSEWAKQVLRQNFRWAPTASSGMGEVGGMASRLPPTWEVYDGPNPDDTEYAVVPSVRYQMTLFDSKHRAYFDISPKPEDGLCLNCHSVSPVGKPKHTLESDVHSSAGIKCVDCHRNGITHEIFRGYEGEAAKQGDPSREEFTCRGCHLGQGSQKTSRMTSGRLGAPFPLHRGISEIHFTKLSCTVCHAGPLPQKEHTRVRTSRANRLGIYGIAQWYTELPVVSEPVYIRDTNGKITPHRLMWPAFWGLISGEKIKPLKPEEVRAAGAGILDVEERIAGLLIILSSAEGWEGSPLLLFLDKTFELNADGGLSLSSLSSGSSESRLWAFKKGDSILPIIPDFDPSVEEQDQDIEIRIENILAALSEYDDPPGQPVFLYKKYVYRLIDGYLDRSGPGEIKDVLSGLSWETELGFISLASPFQLQTVHAVIGKEQTLTEEQVKRLLNSLTEKNTDQDMEEWNYFYISSGNMFSLDKTGELQNSRHSAASPIAWPLGHQVRPARQSLGIGGCRDCHKADSPFFFNTLKGTGPLVTQASVSLNALSFMALDKPYQKLFGLSFTVRPILKAVLLVAAGIAGLFLLLAALLFAGKISGLIKNRSSQ